MRCPTCGETLEPGTSRCPTCGAAVTSLVPRLTGVKRCPRCGYHGEGVSYFSRPGHVGLLVGVSVFTYGLGGLVYWLARRKHQVCPNCGLGWEQSSALVTSPAMEQPRRIGSEREDRLPSGGVKRRVLGTIMILLATFIVLMGIVEFEAAAIVVGSVMGAGGSGMFYWGWKAMQGRRQALLTGLQRKVLRLATQRGGTLTVTDVAADLNLSIPAAEKVLIEMDDGFRVRSEITKDGIILYEFPEVLLRSRLGPGHEAS